MIVEGILTVVKGFLLLIMSPLNFPSLPEGLLSFIHAEQFGNAVFSGVSILAGYTHFSFLSGLFLFVMYLHVMELVYKWICWVLRKIPLLNVRG